MAIKKTVTMKDVAMKAGVSQPTVSHVINGTTFVSPGKKEAVLNAIKELGYVPNVMAQNLKSRSSKVIGLIVPDVGIGYYSEIVRIIEMELSKEGYVLILCNTFYDSELEDKHIATLIQYNPAGIIFGYELVNDNIYKSVKANEIPSVILDGHSPKSGLDIPSIEMNNILGAKLAVDHLYSNGARKIAFVSEPLISKALIDRYEGYKMALDEKGIEYDSTVCFIEKNEYDKLEMGYSLSANLLTNSHIDAVFVSSDQVTYGVIDRLREYDIKIPEDMLVLGYDDNPISKIFNLTTIAQPKAHMSELGAKTLLRLIRNEALSDDEKRFDLEPSIIIRKSTVAKG